MQNNPKKITRRHFMTLTGISEAVKDHVILAHRFFGKQLPKAHGAPLRALVPDRYFT
jgi:DMSO/TMAO reductase YedYZ molybdopterin-dependent catalytic subunit